MKKVLTTLCDASLRPQSSVSLALEKRVVPTPSGHLLLLLDREERNNWMAVGERCEVMSTSDNYLKKNDLMSLSDHRWVQFPIFQSLEKQFFITGDCTPIIYLSI